jgi:anti-sigma factor RsiW
METWRLADLHAYVDDFLEPDDRLAFENEMARDPALARRAGLWRAQNSAIRAAFDGEGARAFSISLVRHQNENPGKARRSATVGGGPSREPPARVVADASRFSANDGGSDPSRPSLWRRPGLATLAVGLLCVWAPAATVIPADGLGAAAVAAFRAFDRPGVAPVELASRDRAESQGWLTARLTRPVHLPPTPAAVTLVGARIAPYPGAPAAFLVYTSQDKAVGLMVKSLDAPATRAPQVLSADGRVAAVWTWRGQGFALVGDLDAASLLKLATDFFDSPVDAGHAAPERG